MTEQSTAPVAAMSIKVTIGRRSWPVIELILCGCTVNLWSVTAGQVKDYINSSIEKHINKAMTALIQNTISVKMSIPLPHTGTET